MAGSLHELALGAEKNLEQLATGLAQAGADKGTVAACTKMADVMRGIVKALGKGQEQTGDTQPPAAAPQDQGPPPAQQPAQHTMNSATADLHAQAQANAQAQRQPFQH